MLKPFQEVIRQMEMKTSGKNTEDHKRIETHDNKLRSTQITLASPHAVK